MLTVAAILVIVALMTRGMVAPADTDTGIMHASMVEDMGQMRGTDPGKVAPPPSAGAGSAIVHDDAGSVHSGLAPGYAPVHDDTGIMHASMVKDMGQLRGTDPGKVAPLNAGAAVIHDDAGSVR